MAYRHSQIILLSLVSINPLAEANTPAHSSSGAASTCGQIKDIYKAKGCCGHASKSSEFQCVPMPKHVSTILLAANSCKDKKPTSNSYWDNVNCTLQSGVNNALEQSGTDVTVGYKGTMINQSGVAPLTDPYWKAGLCPVNVHWHLGTEHRSAGEYDETGVGPTAWGENHRRLGSGAKVRKGFNCVNKYDASNTKFTTEYAWQHCVGMKVGETYEIHWPHSAAGNCGGVNQYQSPFYDGVFCTDNILSLNPLNTYFKIGVQAQIFTIINDDTYFYPDLMRGMIVDGTHGQGVTKYTGSTTGTSRSNTICSKYTPITWQVDRKCHLISASSFDKLCADMKAQRDDMSSDMHAHGARELVESKFAANNHQRL